MHLPLRVTKEQVTYFATPHQADFQPDRFPVWIWMDDPCFYGFPTFGEAGPKAGQDAGGEEVDAETRTFEPDQAALTRTVDFLGRYLPKALGPIIYTKTCLYTLTPDRDFVVDTLPGHPNVSVGHRRRARVQVRVAGRADAVGAGDRREDRAGHRAVSDRPGDPAAVESAGELHGVTGVTRGPSRAQRGTLPGGVRPRASRSLAALGMT